MDIQNAIVALEEIRDVVEACDGVEGCHECDEKTKEKCLALSNDRVYEAVDMALYVLKKENGERPSLLKTWNQIMESENKHE